MKKSLIALAVLGAMSSAASAQSNVTLYGIIDVGVQWNKIGKAPSTTGGVYTQESALSVDGGYQSGSRWGLRGSEALGGNWNAIFTLEGGYDPSTGTLGQGGRLFGRQVWAGLQHSGMGSIVFGRVATPSSGTGSWDLWGAVDPFATGWGINSLGSTFIPSNALREDNAVLWASPSWGPFKFAASYSGNINGAESVPQGANTSAYTLAGNFNWGPIFASITYDDISPTDALGGPDQKMTQLGAVLNLKVVKIHGAYAIQDNIRLVPQAGNPGAFAPTGATAYDNQAYMLGVSVTIFKGSLLASYQYSNAKNVNTATYQFEPDYSVWGIGYSLPFSRRTNMYVGYGKMEWDGSVAYTSGVQADPSSRFNKEQFALGLRHLF